MLQGLREEIKQEILGIVLLSLAALVYLAILPTPRGGFQEIFVLGLQTVFGRAARVVPALMGVAGVFCILKRGHVFAGIRGFGWGLVLVTSLGWLHQVGSGIQPGYEFANITYPLGGGVIGAVISWGLREAFGVVGRDVALGCLTLVAFLLATDLSLVHALSALWTGASVSAKWTGRSAAKVIGAIGGRNAGVHGGRASQGSRSGTALIGRLGAGAQGGRREGGRSGPEPRFRLASDDSRSRAGLETDGSTGGVSGRLYAGGTRARAPGDGVEARSGVPASGVPGAAFGGDTAGPVIRGGAGQAGDEGRSGPEARPGAPGWPGVSVQLRVQGQADAAERVALSPVLAEGGRPFSYEQITLSEDLLYEVPPLTLLDPPSPARGRRIRQDLEEKARLLEEGLSSYGVKGKVIDARRGPVVTRFEFQPAPGIKVARVVSLSDDIALLMASEGVRIEAPIPGKHAIGIEVPNLEVSTVPLREVLEDPEVRQMTSKLAVVFGKDITGRPIVGDLGRLLHVLIAGATGSGKSVCINSLIASLLFRAKPSEVKLLLIDPKVVELSVYDGIPHLVAPVVTDPKKAAGCLRWAVKQMEERYELFAAAGVRDIGRYNSLFAEWRGGEGAPAAAQSAEQRAAASPQPLPYIVIIIDELNDLMMVAPVDVEDAIWRLAQMARAAGIHLVVATQRPSVDVITGTIKANIPSRVAFAVSSQIDSRTILDTHGAEKLVGRGDMLYMPGGTTKPVRVQGAYVSDREIEALVEYVKSQGRPRYTQDIMAVEVPEKAEEAEADDELFEDAVRVVMETGQASISMLQRKLRVGYTRAGRLIDMMEEKGIVGPFEGSKARDIMMTFDQYRRSKEAARKLGDKRAAAEQAAALQGNVARVQAVSSGRTLASRSPAATSAGRLPSGPATGEPPAARAPADRPSAGQRPTPRPWPTAVSPGHRSGRVDLRPGRPDGAEPEHRPRREPIGVGEEESEE